MGADFRWIPDHKGHPQCFFIEHSLVEEAVLTKKVALICCIYDNGILGQSFLVKVFQQFSNIIVDRRAAAKKILHKLLIDLLPGLDAVQFIKVKWQTRIPA